MQTPAIDPDLLAHDWAVRGEIGAVLVVVALALAPLTVLVVRRIFPGRNVVFARWGFSHALVVLVLGLVLVWLSQMIWPPQEGPIDMQIELVRMATILAAIAALIARFAHTLDPEGWRALGLWRGFHVRAIAAGVTAYVLSLPGLLGLGLAWPWFLEWTGAGFEPQALAESFRTLPENRVGLVLVLGIGVLPLFEEILFRVFLQPLLVQNFSEKGGVLLTSILFAALHGQSAFLPVFGLSLVLGAVMLRTQRLAAVWAVHALHNALMFTWLMAYARSPELASGPGLLGLPHWPHWPHWIGGW